MVHQSTLVHLTLVHLTMVHPPLVQHYLAIPPFTLPLTLWAVLSRPTVLLPS